MSIVDEFPVTSVGEVPTAVHPVSRAQ
jgi:hypothetical protein